MLRAGGLAAWATIAAACTSAKPTPSKTVPNPSPPVGSAGSGPTTAPAPSSSVSASSAPVVNLGGQHVATKAAISAGDARRFAPIINGHWRGAWRDTSGGSGTSDLVIAIDVRRRTVRATVEVAGPILGGTSTVLPVTYEVDLLGFALNAPAWNVSSPQLGKVAVTADGGVSLTATATQVPDHPEIAKIDISGTRLGRRVDGRYTITGSDGSTTTGTIAWASGPQRATPADPNDTKFNSIADVMSGKYAASFGTPSQLSAAMGRKTQLPVANGGRIAYTPGIDVSNATATTADGELVIQYSVYRGSSARSTAQFWKRQLMNQPDVHGPWQAAFYQPGFATLYAYRGNRVLTVNITQTVGAKHPPTADALLPRVLAVAKVLAPQLNSR